MTLEFLGEMADSEAGAENIPGELGASWVSASKEVLNKTKQNRMKPQNPPQWWGVPKGQTAISIEL